MAQRSTDSRKNAGLLAELLNNLNLVGRLMADPRVSLTSKLVLPALALIYLLSPVDLVPDLLPVLGQLDDVAVLLLLARLFIQLAPAEVVAYYRAAMARQSGAATSRQGRGPQESTDAGEDPVIDATYRVMPND